MTNEEYAKEIERLKNSLFKEKEKNGIYRIKNLKILTRCLDILEEATFHDGRYLQKESFEWQDKAQPIVRELAEILDRKPYEDYK